jgi:hypothetical protein
MPSMLAAGPVAKPTGKYARLAAIREWRQAQREKREKEKQQVWVWFRRGILPLLSLSMSEMSL